MKTKPRDPVARFAYEGLDRVLHERARLSILTSLVTSPRGLTFNDLKQLCGLTDGNLSRHLRVLEKGKVVEIVKGHEHKRPQTLCRITLAGRKRFVEYISELEHVVRDAAEAGNDESALRLLSGLAPSRA